jgi:hypothetical protein
MHLVQLLLPLHDNAGVPFPRARFDEVRRELAERFGGVTAYVRSPASGTWQDDAGTMQRDDSLLFEAMCETLDRDWWRSYRRTLEARFAQDEIMLRALALEKL